MTVTSLTVQDRATIRALLGEVSAEIAATRQMFDRRLGAVEMTLKARSNRKAAA